MNFSDTRSFLTGERVERRLAAILVADVVSYSRLMHFDEETTHARVTALLTDAVLPAVAAHGGRVVKNTGDGFLAEFPSAVDAVRSAVRFQDLVFERTIDDAEQARIQFRVGINIGDVIVGAHDIFGDDVNIAARLEALAEPGGICLSSSALDQVRGKVNAEFTDLGEQSLKNIARPVRAYALVAGDGGRSASSRATVGERALALDRNLADAHGCIGMAKYFVGRAIETEGHVQEALRLSPRDIFANRWLLFVGIAKGQLGQDEEAVVWLRRSIEVNRNFPLAHFHLAEALALLGELDEARAAAQAELALDPESICIATASMR